jgi:hypothetical protein
VEKIVDGPVKKVDPASNTVEVGWMLGLFSTTLAVTGDTHIAVEGAKGSLTDIREGDSVKAAYEVRDGKNFAKSIEVTPEEPQASTGRPGSPMSGPASQPQRSMEPGAPPPDAPKAGQ